MIQGLHFLPGLVGEGFVYVERRRLCICGEEKALYMWRREGFAYERSPLPAKVCNGSEDLFKTTQYLIKRYFLVVL